MTRLARGRTTAQMSDSPPASPSPSQARAPRAGAPQAGAPQAGAPRARAPRAGAPHSADGHGGLRLLALGAVAFGVLLLAAAAFVLSYAGIHAVALSAGVSPRLARIYPVIFDAMLVVTCAAVLSLRGAGLPSRTYAWLSMLALLAAAAAADALNATATKLPRRPAAATAAVIPWALVLIGFGLLLCMLRQGRLRRAAAAAAAAAADLPHAPAAADLPHAEAAAEHASDLAIDAEPGQDDPASDEAGPAEGPEFALAPRHASEEQAAGYARRYRDRSASAFSPAPTLPQTIDPAPVTVSSDVEPSPAAGLGPEAELGPQSQPSPEAEPSPEAGLDPDTEPSLEAEAGVEAEVAWEPEVLAEPGLHPETEPEVASAAETQADPGGTEAKVWPEADPLPATPHFDRKRSSPIPPET
jgi:Protein of unknown function (DUF2637)